MRGMDAAQTLLPWLKLVHAPHVGAARAGVLLEKFGSAAAICDASRAALTGAGLADESITALQISSSAAIDADLEWAQGTGNHILTRQDTAYPALLRELADPPPLPGPDRCLSTSSASGAEPIGLHRNVELRLDPALGWLRDEPNGSAEVNGWMRFPDRASDAWGLLLFSDGMPPSVFERLGRIVGHTPTMQLTTHLFSLPDTAWVRGRFRTRLRAGSLLDEDGELWDANGKIVATARQLALLRS